MLIICNTWQQCNTVCIRYEFVVEEEQVTSHNWTGLNISRKLWSTLSSWQKKAVMSSGQANSFNRNCNSWLGPGEGSVPSTWIRRTPRTGCCRCCRYVAVPTVKGHDLPRWKLHRWVKWSCRWRWMENIWKTGVSTHLKLSQGETGHERWSPNGAAFKGALNRFPCPKALRSTFFEPHHQGARVWGKWFQVISVGCKWLTNKKYVWLSVVFVEYRSVPRIRQI